MIDNKINDLVSRLENENNRFLKSLLDSLVGLLSNRGLDYSVVETLHKRSDESVSGTLGEVFELSIDVDNKEVWRSYFSLQSSFDVKFKSLPCEPP